MPLEEELYINMDNTGRYDTDENSSINNTHTGIGAKVQYDSHSSSSKIAVYKLT